MLALRFVQYLPFPWTITALDYAATTAAVPSPRAWTTKSRGAHKTKNSPPPSIWCDCNLDAYASRPRDIRSDAFSAAPTYLPCLHRLRLEAGMACLFWLERAARPKSKRIPGGLLDGMRARSARFTPRVAATKYVRTSRHGTYLSEETAALPAPAGHLPSVSPASKVGRRVVRKAHAQQRSYEGA
ncbi:hypothetical protein Purlil1_3482 [Purpureocillium lilacinum]|uniref:Uncharacterized protein n=1 Tax=Purpureocillium lilacinum TaxID=33203 RepID=A0ABR0C7U1_PURLI|nr:hypothetical protein Purlil1_3482 [Purpureocillium lilacinum]